MSSSLEDPPSIVLPLQKQPTIVPPLEGQRRPQGQTASLSGETSSRSFRAEVGPAPKSPMRWPVVYKRTTLLIDICAGISGAGLALALRVGGPTGRPQLYSACLVLLPVCWAVVLWCNRIYEHRLVRHAREEIVSISHATAAVLAVVAVISYALKLEIARGFVVVALPATAACALLGRLVVLAVGRNRRRRGSDALRVLLVGQERSVGDLTRELRREAAAGMRIIGACVPGRDSPRMAGVEVPVLGDIRSVPGVVKRYGIDIVAVSAGAELGMDEIRRLCWGLEDSGASIALAPGLIDVSSPRLHIRPVSGLPLLFLNKPELTGARRFMKTALDKTLAALGLVFLTPAMLLIAVLIKASGPGPILFRQERIGEHGEPFTLFKLRSMHLDAEARKAELRQLNECADGLLFKIRNDPRVTPVGRFLRRFSLDELPQLINVLLGDMSLVGPRPQLPSEVEQYDPGVERRLLVRPGLTGLWQVSGRSDLTWEESVRLDLRYVENWSPGLDLLILARTVAAVIKRDGAY